MGSASSSSSSSLREYLLDRYAANTKLSSLLEPSELISMLLSLCLIGVVIPTLFFFVGSRVESQVMTKQANYVVDGLTANIKTFTTPSQQAKIQTLIDTYVAVPDMSAQDAAVAAKNQQLLKEAYKSIGIGVAVLLGLIAILLIWDHFRYDGDWGGFPLHEIFWENLFSILGVAGTELAVLFIVGANYKSADINTVKRQIVTAVKDFAGGGG